MLKRIQIFFSVIMSVLFLSSALFGVSLVEQRRYEPVVLSAYENPVRPLAGARVDQIYMYAWDDAAQQWRLMPFQIDEQTFGPKPLNPSVNKWYYFIPEEWADIDTVGITEHDHIFNDHDELVFMVADCGDKAPEDAVLEENGGRLRPKVELVLKDPGDPSNVAYAYLFTSAEKKEVPDEYQFQYIAEDDRIETKYYGVGLNEHGAVDELIIQPPVGSGVDLLDQLKIRFSGVGDFTGFPIEILVREDDFFLYPNITVSEKPIVRLIRQSYMTLQLGDFVVEELSFPVVTKFYPYNGVIEGGTSLAPEDLYFYYDSTAIQLIVKNMRESWDYNENAVGMKFYNEYNDGVLIDGVPDVINDSVDLPINAWDLTTGDHGSIFKVAHFTEQDWNGVKTYYWDNQNGGQADSSVFDNPINAEDTGDGVSFGDNGILFLGKPEEDSVTLELDYTIFFLPESNLTQSFGREFADIVNSNVIIAGNLITSVAQGESTPGSYALFNNYPNPFNGATIIKFSTPTRSFVRLTIYDVNGRVVSQPAAGYFNAGTHEVKWDGRSDRGELAPSGVYYCRMKADDFTGVLKLLMIR